MRIWTSAGDVPIKQFTFPDGQRHLEILLREPGPATIEARIANADELFDVLLAKDALSTRGCPVALDIRYLLGARMDRQLSPDQPFTLAVVARQLLSAGFQRIRVLDPHSEASLRLLGASAVYPQRLFARLLLARTLETILIAPDVGATDRVQRLSPSSFRILQGHKHRDPLTGTLSAFSVEDTGAVRGKSCLIVDDLCDGGGTFVGLARLLNDAGATAVDLFVTHGIFSKGTPLKGLRAICTTDSYLPGSLPLPGVTMVPIRMQEEQ